jgi:hypothetical protein
MRGTYAALFDVTCRSTVLEEFWVIENILNPLSTGWG